MRTVLVQGHVNGLYGPLPFYIKPLNYLILRLVGRYYVALLLSRELL